MLTFLLGLATYHLAYGAFIAKKHLPQQHANYVLHYGQAMPLKLCILDYAIVICLWPMLVIIDEV